MSLFGKLGFCPMGFCLSAVMSSGVLSVCRFRAWCLLFTTDYTHLVCPYSLERVDVQVSLEERFQLAVLLRQNIAPILRHKFLIR